MATTARADVATDVGSAERPTNARPGVRWAGAALAVSALTFPITILLYVIGYGQPAGTGAGGEVTLRDSALYMLERWWFISKVWIVEATAMTALTVAGFALQRRARSGPAWFPAPIAWLMVGIGGLLQTVMYAFMLGGYPATQAELDGTLSLYDALRGSATFLFNLGNAVLYLGLAGALLAEAAPGGVIPRRIALIASAICFITAGITIGLLWGVGNMMMAAPGALLGFVAAAYLGLSIWKRG